jgi:hypothetical protein
MEAYRSLADLLEQAEKVRSMFERAGSALPDALQRLVKSNGNSTSHPMEAVFKPVSSPAECETDWVWVDLESAAAGTLALAILRQSGEHLTTREIHERVLKLPGMSDVLMGTIANTGTRAFENRIITRTDEGQWELLDPEKAALIHGNHLWGRPDVFQMQELAAHRRNAIVHLLRQNPVGLQQAQIVAQLRQNELVRPPIPVSKSLVKADLEAMDGDRVRRRGNSKKWEAI